MTHPTFSIIITAFNEGNWLEFTLTGLLASENFEAYEIILVNDGSTDGCFDFLEEKKYQKLMREQKIQLLRGQQLGVARGRHVGAERARGEYLLFLDAHMKIEPSFLSEVHETLRNHSEIHILGVNIYDFQNIEDYNLATPALYTNNNISMFGPGWVWRDPHKYSEDLYAVPYVIAACFIVRRHVYEAVGGFSKYIIGWGPEDRTFCLQAYYLGYDSYIHTKIYIGHLFKKAQELSPEVNDKKKMAHYNALICSYLLYEGIFFSMAYSYLKNTRNFEEAKVLFLQNKKELTAYKKSIRSQSKRTFQDFVHDFHEVLPFLYTAYYERGEELRKEGGYKKAISYYKKALGVGYMSTKEEKKDFQLAVCLRLAEMYQYLGYKKEQERFVEKGYALKSDFLPVLIEKTKLLFEKEAYREAFVYTSGALELIEEDLTALYSNSYYVGDQNKLYSIAFDQASIVYHHRKQYEKAFETVEKALWYYPEDERLQGNREIYRGMMEKYPAPNRELIFNPLSF